MDFAERSAQGGATGVAFTKHPEDIHVLLVDDEKLSRVVVGNLLRKCSYKGRTFLQAKRSFLLPTLALYFTQRSFPLRIGAQRLRSALLLAKCSTRSQRYHDLVLEKERVSCQKRIQRST